MQDLRLPQAAAALRAAITAAARGLVEREVLVELVALCAVAGEHALVLGPPGTAKSEAVRRVAQSIGGRYFEYLLGRFTEPSEVFGPIDLRKLREGLVVTETAGMLPAAEVAFLDEIFLGSTAILNTLLGILNERVFRRGHTIEPVPLRVCVGAANVVPEDEALAAFADRFLVRVFVESLPDSRLEELLEGGGSLGAVLPGHPATLAHLGVLSQAAAAADLGAVRPHLAHAVRLLRAAGIHLTDRRVVKTQRLLAAAAALDGRAAPSTADLWPLLYAVPTADGQRIAREVLRPLLEGAENASLPAAAENASQGPLARAARVGAAAEQLLGTVPSEEERPAWRLRLEGVAREIDAGFDAAALPAELAAVRARLLACLEEAP